jgi:hypothetical protein
MNISNNYSINFVNNDQLLANKDEQAEESSKKQEGQKDLQELSSEEKQQVYELQARDTEVRAHEAAHQAAGGGMTGGANYSYQRGPDGKMYAIGGEVSISMPKGSTPEEVIANAQQVIAAALAPADPSAQDMSVAASARAMMIEAQQQKAKESYEEMSQENSSDTQEDENSKLDLSA